MSEARIVVWHDGHGSDKWLVAVQDASGRHYAERPYIEERDAVASANVIGRSMRWPVFRLSADQDDELIQAAAPQ